MPTPSLPAGIGFDERAWQELWRSSPGSAKRRCVAVEDHTWVRSGEFVVGNFAAYRNRWDGTYENSKLAYTPLDPTDNPPLTVTAETIGTEPTEFIDPVQWIGQGAVSSTGYPFYPTATVLPHGGSWRLVAQAGPNWGCFELTI